MSDLSLLAEIQAATSEGQREVDVAVAIDVERARKFAVEQVKAAANRGQTYTYFRLPQDQDSPFPFTFKTLRALSVWFKEEGFIASNPDANGLDEPSIKIIWG